MQREETVQNHAHHQFNFQHELDMHILILATVLKIVTYFLPYMESIHYPDIDE